MSYDETEDFKANYYAKKIVQQVTNDKMSQAEKFEICFRWAMKPRQYRSWRKFIAGGDMWYALSANDYFERNSGNCLATASSFAYLAKALGYKNVYICSDGPRTQESSHTWTEVGGRVYDPLFARTRNFKLHYGVTYETYKKLVNFRVKIS